MARRIVLVSIGAVSLGAIVFVLSHKPTVKPPPIQPPPTVKPVRTEIQTYKQLVAARTNRPATLSKSEENKSDALESSLKLALKEKDRAARSARLRQLGIDAAKLDVTRALLMAQSIFDVQDFESFLRGVVHEWVTQNRDEALASCGSVDSLSLRSALTAEAISTIGEHDRKWVSEWVNSQPPGDVRDKVVQDLANSWSKEDPTAAAQWALSLTDEVAKKHALESVLQNWAADNPEAVVQWLNTLSPGTLRDDAIATFAMEWAAHFPADAAKWAGTLAGTPEGDAAIEAIATKWGYQSPQAALEWLMNLPNPEQRAATIAGLFAYYAEANPAAAIKMTGQLQTADLQEQALLSVASTWAGNNPVEAMNWINSVFGNDLRNRAYEAALSVWSVRDASGASTWIQSLPSGPAKDSAMVGFTTALAQSDPRRALDMATKIQDPQVLSGLIPNVFSQWSSTHPGPANKWLEQAAIPPELKQQLENERRQNASQRR
jgi:hypothetical protein